VVLTLLLLPFFFLDAPVFAGTRPRTWWHVLRLFLKMTVAGPGAGSLKFYIPLFQFGGARKRNRRVRLLSDRFRCLSFGTVPRQGPAYIAVSAPPSALAISSPGRLVLWPVRRCSTQCFRPSLTFEESALLYLERFPNCFSLPSPFP